jgi:MAF protein
MGTGESCEKTPEEKRAMKLILASSSPYRQGLLRRLRLPFESVAPAVDESPRSGEAPAALARRLSLAKAEAVAASHPGACVIGSDQVASLDGKLLFKPRTAARAVAQLSASSGRRVTFETGICLLAPGAEPQLDCVSTQVHFRSLTEMQLARYVELDQPLDCAGSFKWESLGIALFERLGGDDPTALEGLPLITLCDMLRRVGIDPLAVSEAG